MQWEKVALQRNHGNQIPFQGGSVEDPRMLHLALGSSQLPGSSSMTSKEFLLLVLVCPVAWIQGQAESSGFGPLGVTSGKNHGEQVEHEAAHETSFTGC